MRTTTVGRLSAAVATAGLIAAGIPAASGATPATSNDSFQVTTASGCVATVKYANVRTAFNYFVKKGYTTKQSAGIVGNLIVESGVDPKQLECGGGPGRGIAQWGVGGRWNTDPQANMLWYADRVNKSAFNLTAQVWFISFELGNNPNYGRASLKKQTSVGGATKVFLKKYERAGVEHWEKRYWHARNVYQKYA